MLAPLSWLNEYVKLSISADSIANKFLFSGNKVDSLHKRDGDYIFDLEITPNRPDTLSIVGLARELSAVLNEDLSTPDITIISSKSLPKNKAIKINVKNKSLCPYYSFGIIDGVKVAQSPSWIVDRLEKSGVRSVNNIVDITNYVMIETGQPMHAFDFEKIKGDLILRASKRGERIKTLDGLERIIPEGSIIIEDDDKIIDLAGLMGGENTEVTHNTKTILVHVPVYNSVSIRRTSLSTGLRTEASNRFEKKLDPNMHPFAFDRARKLISEIAGGMIIGEKKSVGFPVKESSLELSLGMITSVLGVEIEIEKIVNILTSLGFRIYPQPLDKNKLKVVIPSWRPDVAIEEDIYEEIGRIYNYNNFPKTLPKGSPPMQPELFLVDWGKICRNIFLSFGLSEILTPTLLSPDLLIKANLNAKEAIKLSNPMLEDYSLLRPSLIPGQLNVIESNLRNFDVIKTFELGKIFTTFIDKLPDQPTVFAFLITGDFQEGKGYLEELLKTFNIKPKFSLSKTYPFFEQERSIIIEMGKTKLGQFGEIAQSVLNNFGIKKHIVAGELLLENLATAGNPDIIYRPIPKFPPVIEDISMFIDKNVFAEKIIDTIKKGREDIVSSVFIFDVYYRGGNKKSVAVRIYYQAENKTLTNRDVSKTRESIIADLKKILQAEIRRV